MDNQNTNNNNNYIIATPNAPVNPNVSLNPNAPVIPVDPNNVSMNMSNVSMDPNSTITTQVPPQPQPEVMQGQSIEQPQQAYIYQGNGIQPQPPYLYQGNVIQPQYPLNPQVYSNEQMPPPPSYQQTVGANSQYINSVNGKGNDNGNNQPQQVVVMVEPDQIPRHSTKMICPHCHKTVDTMVSYEDNALVWGLCFILFIFTFLCCIPFCIDDLKDVVHYCPICRKEIARRERVV